MPSSPKCQYRPNAIILKYHHRPNAIIAQMPSSSNVISAQIQSSPKCHHRPMPSSPKAISIHFLHCGASMCLTAHPPPYNSSFYTLISLLDVSWCVKLDGSCSQQQKCWIILSKLRSSGHMQLFKISYITCLSALKETDHWLERQKRFNMVIFTIISNHISMLVHANSMCVICLSTGLVFWGHFFLW